MYTKKHQKIKSLLGALALVAFLLQSGMVSALDSGALPTNGKITSGKGSISTSGSQMTIKQSTEKMIANWDTFNIGKKAGVTFKQPDSSAIALNKIYDQNPSQIFGKLSANGNIFLINPSGIVFGKGAQVNVGGLVASSLDMLDSDFLAGKYIFTNNGSSGSVLNQGKISVIPGGVVALIAPAVTNEGTITAAQGDVLLAAGDKVTLNLNRNNLISYTVDKGAIDALAENSGLIKADGGQVILTARAADKLTSAVVNNTGVIEAQTLKKQAGRIMLMSDMENGQTLVDGTLDASAPKSGNGGFIETSAASVKVSDNVKVTTYAPRGSYGLWLIDPQDYTVAASGGDITGTALSTNLATTSIALQSSGGGTVGSGNVNINDNVSWSANSTLTLTASNNVNVNSDITATGNTAGLVISPNTANGVEAASGTGVFNLNNGAVITLSGSTPSLTIAAKPYTVINEANGGVTALQNINKNRAGYYALGSNIDASVTSTWAGGFTSIGRNNGQSFTGQFDGLGHTINNITITPTTGPGNVGLFGYVGGGTIKNVGLVNVTVIGKTAVGGLVGYMSSGTIANAYVTGSVTSTVTGGGINVNASVGGLVGYNESGTVSNSYSASSIMSSVTGTDENIYVNNVGGLIGYNAGAVNNSYATGNVTGTSTTTGTGTINNYVGGLVGDNAGTVGNAYAVGHVSGAGNGTFNVGGLAGKQTGTINSSYWDTDTTGQATSAGGTGLTTAQMKTMSSYSDWDIANTGGTSADWRIYEGYAYPLLRRFLVPVTITPAFNGGGVYADITAYLTDLADFDASKVNTTVPFSLLLSSSATPGTATASLQGLWSSQHGYDISNAARTLNGTGSNANDLRIGQGISWSSGNLILNAANNIIIDSTMNGSGTAQLSMLHGQGAVASGNTATYTVNAPVNLPAGDNFFTKLGSDGATKTYRVITQTGAVGSTTAADLQGMNGNLAGNFALGSHLDATATSGWNGGLGFTPIGNATTPFTGTFEGLNHTVSNLYINRPTENYVGLFGYIGSSGTVSNVGLVDGSASGFIVVGGLAGANFGNIKNSYAMGSASGRYNVGVLAGYNFGTVENSYATGSTSGMVNVGSLVGYNGGTVKNSCATGSVTGDYYVGMLVGYNDGTVEDSYATGSVSGGVVVVGGLIGYNGGTVENSYATGSVTGRYNVGGLAGYNFGTVANSYATGSASGMANVGGLAGYNYNFGTIENSYATGSVTGNYYAGGLAGYNEGTVENSYATGNVSGVVVGGGGLAGYNGGIVQKSYATGSVNGNYYIGGLSGYNRGTVQNSYASGSVNGNYYIGGLAGYNGGIVEKSYAKGLVNNGVAKSTVGGLIGYAYGGSTTNSFWDIQTTGQAVSAGGIGKTTTEMMTPTTFTDAGWDTTNIWTIASYPTLKVFD